MTSAYSIHCPRSAFSSIDQVDAAAMATISLPERLLQNDGTEAPPTIGTLCGIEWNEHGFLVFFRGLYNDLRMSRAPLPERLPAKSHALWESSDVFECFIGPDASRTKGYKEFQVSPDGRSIDIDVQEQLGTTNPYWYSGSRCRSFVEPVAKRWSAVMELPWGCFGSHRRTEERWNVNLYRASGAFHGDELLAWSPPGTGPRCFHRPEHFGTIIFEP